jgi:N-acetylmuramoyl-L-alanine amidase
MKITDHLLFDDEGQPVPFQRSPNRGEIFKPRYLIIHYTAGRSAESSADWLCQPRARASAHVVIGKDGKIIQLVPFNVVAWHAGKSRWTAGATELVGMNRYALGIELDNPGKLVRQGRKWWSLSLGASFDDAEVIEATHKNEGQPAGWFAYPQPQLDAALEVASLMFATYGLEDVLGHDDVAPTRKVDPGPAFPMESFRTKLLGRADDTTSVAPRFATTAPLNVRRGPGTEHEPVIPNGLPVGTTVEVLAQAGSWRQVDVLEPIGGLHDVQGWVHGRYLRPVAG